MDFKLEAPTALSYFASLVQSDAHFPLLEAAASLAQDEYPDEDIEEVLDQVDVLIQRIHERLPSDAGAVHKLRMLNKFFFEELGFAGNLNHFYDPRNSFMSEVLRRRVGIPISLAVVWLELAQSLGLQAKGVNFPGHFLVKVRLPYPHEGHVVIDPFSGLAPLFAETGLVRDGEAVSDDLLAHYLRAATPREIVARMLRNLEEIYLGDNDITRLLQVRQRLLVLLPTEEEDADASDAEDAPD